MIVAAIVTGAAAAADPFPTKPLHIITALPAGLDAYIRVFGARFAEQLGQPVVVDNRPGGAFVPPARALTTAAPDGHTVLIYSVIFLIVKNVQPSVAFDPLVDFAPIVKIYGNGASILVVRPDSAFKSIQDVIAIAKASPGKVNYGGPLATGAHLNAASFLAAAGVTGFHVPSRVVNDDITGFLRGDIDLYFSAGTVVLPMVASGKMRAIGVTSGTRMRLLPDVPTLREVLNNDLLVQDNWTGLAAPPKTPGEIVARLHAETMKAIGHPEMRKIIDAGGNDPAAGESTAEFTEFIRRENDKWREIVKLSGIKVE